MGNKNGRVKDGTDNYLVDASNEEEYKKSTLESRIKNNIREHLGTIDGDIINGLNNNKTKIIEGLLSKEFLILYTSKRVINYTFNFPYPMQKSINVNADLDIKIHPIKYKSDVKQVTNIWKKNMSKFVNTLQKEGYISDKKNIKVDIITNPKTLSRKLKKCSYSDMISNSFIVVTIGTKNFF